jgi:flagellar hook-associated protein 2
MASTSLQVAGLASNFDWKAFTDQIMELERAPAARLEAEQTKNNTQNSLLSTLGSRLSALNDAADALTGSLFGKRTAASGTTGSTWGATAGADTAAGTYRIAVSQLATSAKLTGANDRGSRLAATADVSGLTVANLPISQAVTAGTFSVNGKQVSVALTDSLQSVFAAIATATGGDVTAAYDPAEDKVTLASTNGNVVLGAANDTSNFLRALKLGNNGTAAVASSAKLGVLKTSATLVNANLSTAVTAVDGSGNGSFAINGTTISYNVNSDSLSAVMQRINDSAAGVNAVYDAVNDRVQLVNKSTGDLGIAVSESAGGLLGALGLTSGTTLARGNNALFTLNGGDTLSSASNSLDVSAHGIAGLVVEVKSETTETVTVASDSTAMRSKIDAFIAKFNEVQQFIDTNTRVSADSKGKVTAAALSGNREIQDWSRSLRTMAFGTVSGLSGAITRLNDLGIDFKSGTNELEVADESALSDALESSTAAVGEFFTKASTGFAAKFGTYLDKIVDQNDDQKERLTKANTSLDDQIAAIDRRLTQQRSLLESAFIAMENAQSKIKQQQTALDGMISQLSGR